MNKSKMILVAGALLLLMANVSHAQLGAAPMPQIAKPTGPSLEETTKWITEKFQATPPVLTTISWDKAEYRYKALFDDCDVTVLQEITTGSRPEVTLYNIPLRELDQDNSKASSGRVSETLPSMFWIKTLGNRKVVTRLKISAFETGGTGFADSEAISLVSNKYLLTKEDPDFQRPYAFNGKRHHVMKFKSDGFWIEFTTLEEAESMGNAFKHAAKLCQQKAAAERANQPAKKKDLF